jgi:hypothetical protein
MSRRTAKQMEKLVKKGLPGYKLSPESSKVTKRQASSGATTGAAGADAAPGPAARAGVDSATPSIAELRRKFLRPVPPASDAAPAANANDDDTDIVLVEPDAGPGGRRRAKAIVLDANGRVLGAQG